MNIKDGAMLAGVQWRQLCHEAAQHPVRDLSMMRRGLPAGRMQSFPFRRRASAAIALLVLPLMAACSRPQEDGVVWHPIPDSLLSDPEQAVVVAGDVSAPASAELRSFADRLRRHATEVSIGVAEGESPYLFGWVSDAEFLEDGALAVVDRQASLVRIFEPDGVYRTTLGGFGEGPGEMNVPLALLAPGPGSLWVVDGPEGLHRFREDAGAWEFQDRVRMVGSRYHSDACASDSTVVVHGKANPEGQLLYALGGSEGRERPFAAPYRYGDPFVVTEVAQGRLACADGLVLLAYERINRVDAWAVGSGDPVRQTTFEGVRMPPIRELPERGGVGLAPQGLTIFHGLLGVTGGKGSPVVVQYARRTAQDLAEGREDRYDIDTYVLDPLTGQGLYVGDEVPRVLAVRGDRLALLFPTPYPRVEIARLGL